MDDETLRPWPDRPDRPDRARVRRRRRRTLLYGAGGTVLAGGMATAGYVTAAALTGGAPSAARAGATALVTRGSAAPAAQAGPTGASSSAGPTGASGATGPTGGPGGPGAPAYGPGPATGGFGAFGFGAFGDHRHVVGFGFAGSGPFGPGGAFGGPALGLYGVVTSASGTPLSITISEADGTSVTVGTTSSTTYTSASGAAAASDVHVGDLVRIEPTSATASSSSPTAQRVAIEQSSVEGTVVSFSGGAIVVRNDELLEQTITVSAGTTYSLDGAKGAASDVTTGAEIVARGTVDPDGSTLDATNVDVVELRVAGTVQSVDGSTIVLAAPGGSVVRVSTGSSTSFVSGLSSTSSSISAVTKGALVMVTGTRSAGGGIDARQVRVLPAGAHGIFGPGWAPGGGPFGPPGMRGSAGATGATGPTGAAGAA